MSKVIFHTDGKRGLWSDVAKAITITDIQLGKGTIWEGETIDQAFGELRVYFDTETWDTRKDGLIYTDRLFLEQLRKFLDEHGLPGKDVCYSEQGMQGANYVSLDAGTEFYEAWMQKFGVAFEQQVELY